MSWKCSVLVHFKTTASFEFSAPLGQMNHNKTKKKKIPNRRYEEIHVRQRLAVSSTAGTAIRYPLSPIRITACQCPRTLSNPHTWRQGLRSPRRRVNLPRAAIRDRYRYAPVCSCLRNPERVQVQHAWSTERQQQRRRSRARLDISARILAPARHRRSPRGRSTSPACVRAGS